MSVNKKSESARPYCQVRHNVAYLLVGRSSKESIEAKVVSLSLKQEREREREREREKSEEEKSLMT